MKSPFRKFYEKFISLNGDPTRIALGMAVGVFVGSFPIIGTQTLILVTLASAFSLHMAAGILGTWMPSNPLTIVPVFGAEFYVGRLLLGYTDISWPEGPLSWGLFINLGGKFLGSLFLGFVVIGSLLAVLSFIVTRWFFTKMQTKEERPAS